MSRTITLAIYLELVVPVVKHLTQLGFRKFKIDLRPETDLEIMWDGPEIWSIRENINPDECLVILEATRE
jgi:hypothetical protein